MSYSATTHIGVRDSAPAARANRKLLELAVAHQQAGRIHEATRLYERLFAIEPTNRFALNFAGIGYAQLGDLDRSISLLQSATQLYPNYVDAHRNLALALREVGQFKRALAEHQRVLELTPEYAEGYNDLGTLMRKVGQLVKAEEAYRRALEIDPNYSEALANLGNVLQDQDKITEAVACYRLALDALPNAATIHRHLGTALQRLNELDEAIASYRRAIKIAPDFALAHTDLGSALIERGSPREGAVCLRRALTLNPRQVDAYTNLGIALHDSGDVQGALTAYNDSLTLEPGNSHAIAYKTIALHALGRKYDVRYLVDFDRLIVSTQLLVPRSYESLSDFNTALTKYAAGHPTLLGGDDRRPGITGELFVDAQGPVRDLVRLIKDAVREYVEGLPVEFERHPFIANRPSQFKIIGWANVLDHGADAHIHPHAWLSGVYYAKPPQPSGGPGNAATAGWLEVGRPDPHRNDTEGYEVRMFEPIQGRLVLFPSYVWHRVLPFKSQEKRVSYAFDVARNS